MPLTHRWTGFNDAELIGQLRLDSYGTGQIDRPKYMASVTDDPRVKDGDFLLIERDRKPVGTATSIRLTGYVRGAELPVHGVAYVGTSRTERRKASVGQGEPGIATLVMQQSLAKARERGDVLSALMPFRASYYEHFGYGIVERQARWVIPVSVLPVAESGGAGSGGIKLFEEHDLPAMMALKQDVAVAGQCDLQRPDGEWQRVLKMGEAGFTVVDRQGPTARSWATFVTETDDAGAKIARVTDWGTRNHADFIRLLTFFGSLKDQYGALKLLCPADWQVSRWLRESQLPHRPVVHATASCTLQTRMQVRVLDHRRLLESITWPPGIRGSAEVCVIENEGHESRFVLTVEGGRAHVKEGGTGRHFKARDSHWAAVALGDVTAREIVRTGLAASETDDVRILDTLSDGPAPYCLEYF